MQTVTNAELGARLGIPAAYGTTSDEVLETCALVAAADEQWNAEQIGNFQEQHQIHEKVWGRLIAIHRCQRWKEVETTNLPGNYTSLYSLVTLSDDEWQDILVSGKINPSLTSRAIQFWKTTRIAANEGFDRQVPFLLAFQAESDKDKLLETLALFKKIAEENELRLIVPPALFREFSTRSTPKEVMESIGNILLPKLEAIVADAGKACRDSLGIQSANELLSASVREFLKFLNRTAGSLPAAMESYGIEHCLKLAYEYNRVANSRANRSNYKKKLVALSEGNSEQAVTHHAKKVIRDFIS